MRVHKTIYVRIIIQSTGRIISHRIRAITARIISHRTRTITVRAISHLTGQITDQMTVRLIRTIIVRA